MTLKTTIVSDDEKTTRRIEALLTKKGLACPANHVIPIESAADRVGRLVPDLLILVSPQDPTTGLSAIREIRATLTHLHCMVVGPTDDAQQILRILREGANEYLDEAQLESQLANTLAQWKAKQAAPSRLQASGRVIATLAPSGGCGSSTVAVNVSAVLAKNHGRCGLIDLRLGAGDLASMLDLKPTHTMADLCEHLDRMDRTMFDQFLVRHASGIHLLAAPNGSIGISRVTPKGVRRAVAMARTRFPYVIVDLDNAIGSDQREALWQADVILLVLRPDYTSLRNSRRILDNLAELGIGMDRVQPVINGYGRAGQLGMRQVEEALQTKLRHFIPNAPGQVNRAITFGLPVVLYRPWAKISRSIRRLAVSVNGRCTTRPEHHRQHTMNSEAQR